MGVRRAVDELLHHRAEIARRLAPGGHRILAEGLRAVSAAPPADQLARAVDLIEELINYYLPDGDPLAEAFLLDETEAYAADGTATRTALGELLADIDLHGALPEPPPPPPPPPESRAGQGGGFGRLGEDLDLVNAVRRDLLAAPAYTPADLRAAGADPDAPGLIRLRRAGGRVQLPVFQFDERRRPRPVVVTVNQLLAAESDPWGVASWWLDQNSWLAGVPAELLGRIPDDEIVAVARVDVQEDA